MHSHIDSFVMRRLECFLMISVRYPFDNKPNQLLFADDMTLRHGDCEAEQRGNERKAMLAIYRSIGNREVIAKIYLTSRLRTHQ